MHRFLRYPAILLAVVIALAADGTAIRDALAALQRGEFAVAERNLRAEVKARPGDSAALTLLGVALDGQNKFAEAADVHRRASVGAPRSPDVWNNYANHLVATGDDSGARKLYLRATAIDPAHQNANVQLARLALKAKKGAEALTYLKHLPGDLQDAPQLAALRIEALYLAGDLAGAERLTAHWLVAGKTDLGATLSIGLALADAGQFEKAEMFLTQALALAPADFTVLSNLGVVALRTGNNTRARDVLESAYRQQPRNVDVLYNLACADHALKLTESAVALLAEAARLAPQRSDIQKLLALTTGDLGALDDSAAAWDRYIKLEPNDDVARRERGLTAFQMGQFEHGVAELRWYVSRHPNDAVGHFELGAAENKDNPSQALEEFDRALALKADFAAAHSARGSLYYQMGKPETALADLEAAASLRPDDALGLDRLGQTYLALDRPADAVRVLRKSATLAPDDAKTQLHLARALADAGQPAESKAAMDRFRQLGPAVNKTIPGGLVDYLSLTPEQRQADYRRRVDRMVREHPEDASAQATWLRLLLEEGDAALAAEVANKLSALKPPAAILADAGRALLAARQYKMAQELLEQTSVSGAVAGVDLDLAIAAFRAAGPAEGRLRLDRIPTSARGAEYYLAQAEMQYASGDAPGALASVEKALQSTQGQAATYRQACTFLLLVERNDDALRISAQAVQALAGDREIMLLRSVVLERAGRTGEAERLLEQIQNRWPEWPAPWLAQGIIWGTHGRRAEATSALQTAVALGTRNLEVKQYLDRLGAGIVGKTPDLTRVLLIDPTR